MKRRLPGLMLAMALALPAFAQATTPGHDGAAMQTGGGMPGMKGDHLQRMREMMGMMREMMPMMQHMQQQGAAPGQQADMMQRMSEMMQDMMPMMQHMTAGMADAQPTSEATAAYRAAGMEMHMKMQIRFTGDADADFAKDMIPHHEGAIALANIVLKYGQDSELRKLAEGVIKAQTAEIATLREWQAGKAK